MNTVAKTPITKAVRQITKTLALFSALTTLAVPGAHAADQASLRIGDHFGGGKVAYILKPGDRAYIPGQTHGLIVASKDLSDADTWKKAVHTSRNYRAGGNSDWRLPNREELRKLYEHRFTIGGFREKHYYWSGVESDRNDAWDMSFRTGKRSLAYKLDCNYIRPVRNF
jgi:hypothetical protein